MTLVPHTRPPERNLEKGLVSGLGRAQHSTTWNILLCQDARVLNKGGHVTETQEPAFGGSQQPRPGRPEHHSDTVQT